MIKSFYKRKRPIKSFFDKSVAVRSTAYGADVAQEFFYWRSYFNEKWNSSEENFLISAQGSIDGNPVRAGRAGGEVKKFQDACREIKFSSVLPPLWLGNLFLEVNKDGFVSVNGNLSAVNIGIEQKAWAIAPVRNAFITENYLFVIAKKIGSSEPSLSAYRITAVGVDKQEIVSVKLENTVEAYSRLVCLGRNIFLVHKSYLDYFYLNSENVLERVGIGADALNKTLDWCKYVRGGVIADGGGRVFWISDNDVYGFEIGSPRKLIRIKGSEGERTERIQCAGDSLFVYSSDKRKNIICRAYEGLSGKEPVSRVFTTDSEFNIIISKTPTALKYVKLVRNGGVLKAQVITGTGSAERCINVFTVDPAGKLFFADGYLADRADYLNVDRNKNCAKIQQETRL